ncbi:MAG TPA: cysteine desulfurase family protein [Terriglobia bacterium]|nr:cysteine desulfurase family protein [Terriglobia bacterium]
MMSIYFDHNATTPLAPEALEAMLPFLRAEYGNAASIHRPGQRARAAVEKARAQVAELLGAQPEEIVFTAGGTESDNLAIQGVVRASRQRQPHVITSAMEHHAVLHTCQALESEGVAVSYLPVSSEGFVDPDDVRRALTPATVLISIMHANNEIGTVQPIAEIAAMARQAGVLFHTDAVQSVGKIPVRVGELGVDLLTLSAHKFGGPKGVGALYVREGVRLAPILYGGSRRGELRPGTENVAGIVGLGAAARLALAGLEEEAARVGALRDRLEQGILDRIEACGVNGTRSGRRVPNTTNLHFDFLEGESLVIALDLQDIACSTGAACSSGAVEPSHVLLALGLSPERARSSLRFSLGRQNTEADVDRLLCTLPGVVDRLRALSPLAPPRLAGKLPA